MVCSSNGFFLQNWVGEKWSRVKIRPGTGEELVADSAAKSSAPSLVRQANTRLLGSAPNQMQAPIQADPLGLPGLYLG